MINNGSSQQSLCVSHLEMGVLEGLEGGLAADIDGARACRPAKRKGGRQSVSTYRHTLHVCVCCNCVDDPVITAYTAIMAVGDSRRHAHNTYNYRLSRMGVVGVCFVSQQNVYLVTACFCLVMEHMQPCCCIPSTQGIKSSH